MRVAKPCGYITALERPDESTFALVSAARSRRRPGIVAEVFLRRELRRVDIDRDDHPPGSPLGERDQRQVSAMQRAHGRYQRERRLAALHARAQGWDRSQNRRAAMTVSIYSDLRIAHYGERSCWIID